MKVREKLLKIISPMFVVGMIALEMKYGRPLLKLGKCTICLMSCHGSRLFKSVISEDALFGAESYSYHIGALSFICLVCYFIWRNKDVKMKEGKLMMIQNMQKYVVPKAGDHQRDFDNQMKQNQQTYVLPQAGDQRDLDNQYSNMEDYTENIVDICNKTNHMLKLMTQITKSDKKFNVVK